MKEAFKYFIDSIERTIKYFIDNTKLTLKKIKVLFFIMFTGVFAYTYFIKIKIVDNNCELTFDPGNVPTSSVFITSILIVFLVLIDFVDNRVRSKRLINLIKSNKIPSNMKEKLLEELVKIK